jgi:hypothetical protein
MNAEHDPVVVPADFQLARPSGVVHKPKKVKSRLVHYPQYEARSVRYPDKWWIDSLCEQYPEVIRENRRLVGNGETVHSIGPTYKTNMRAGRGAPEHVSLDDRIGEDDDLTTLGDCITTTQHFADPRLDGDLPFALESPRSSLCGKIPTRETDPPKFVPLDFLVGLLGAEAFVGVSDSDSDCQKATPSETARAIERRDSKRRRADELAHKLKARGFALSESAVQDAADALGISRRTLSRYRALSDGANMKAWWDAATARQRRDFQWVAGLFGVECSGGDDAVAVLIDEATAHAIENVSRSRR